MLIWLSYTNRRKNVAKSALWGDPPPEHAPTEGCLSARKREPTVSVCLFSLEPFFEGASEAGVYFLPVGVTLINQCHNPWRLHRDLTLKSMPRSRECEVQGMGSVVGLMFHFVKGCHRLVTENSDYTPYNRAITVIQISMATMVLLRQKECMLLYWMYVLPASFYLLETGRNNWGGRQAALTALSLASSSPVWQKHLKVVHETFIPEASLPAPTESTSHSWEASSCSMY